MKGVALLIFLLFYALSEAAAQSLIPIFENEKIGFINSTGKVIVKPVWYNATRFSEGLASVRRTEKYGYIDGSGKIVIPEKFDYALPFRNGRAIVYINGEKKEIDKKGNFIKTEKEVILEELSKYGIKELAFISKFPGNCLTIAYLEKGQYGEKPVLFDKNLKPLSKPGQYNYINWGHNNDCQAGYENSLRVDVLDENGKIVFQIRENDSIYISQFITADSMLIGSRFNHNNYWINRNREILNAKKSFHDYEAMSISKIDPLGEYSLIRYVGKINKQGYFFAAKGKENLYTSYLFREDGTILYQDDNVNWGDVFGETYPGVIIFESEESQTIFDENGKIIYRNIKDDFNESLDSRSYISYKYFKDSTSNIKFNNDVFVDTCKVEKRIGWADTRSMQDHYRFYINPIYNSSFAFVKKSESYTRSNILGTMEFYYMDKWLPLEKYPDHCFGSFPDGFNSNDQYFAQVPIYEGDVSLPCRINIRIMNENKEILLNLYSNIFYNAVNPKIFNPAYSDIHFDEFIYPVL